MCVSQYLQHSLMRQENAVTKKRTDYKLSHSIGLFKNLYSHRANIATISLPSPKLQCVAWKKEARQQTQLRTRVHTSHSNLSQQCIELLLVKCNSRMLGSPVALSVAVEPVVSDDRSLIVHSHGRVPPECVACVVVGSETGAEYTESSGVAW